MKTTYPANCLAFKNAIILFNNPVLYDTVIPYYSIRVDNGVIGIKTHEYKHLETTAIAVVSNVSR